MRLCKDRAKQRPNVEVFSLGVKGFHSHWFKLCLKCYTDSAFLVLIHFGTTTTSKWGHSAYYCIQACPLSDTWTDDLFHTCDSSLPPCKEDLEMERVMT